MEIEAVTSDRKPSKAPASFEVTIFDDEEYIFCPIRNRCYKVSGKPEEIVRQWWIYRLRDVYGYAFDQISVEVGIKVGSTEAKKKADIVVYQDKSKKRPRVFVEVKRPNRKDGVDQLQVYMNATGCRLGLWSNGDSPHIYLLRLEPKEGQENAAWRELRNIPRKNESLEDVDSPITRADLEPVKDFLGLLRECEDYIKAHEGVSPFDEVFKLIFAKIFDERRNLKNNNSPSQFRVGVFEAPESARSRVVKLFGSAKEQWQGVFNEDDQIELGDETLAFCVSALQKSFLLKSDADVLGSAFEVMINPSMKGDKGQYFTPRHVVDMCIAILKPGANETIYDPACGSGGFLIGAMDYVFATIAKDRDDKNEILENQKDYASHNVFGTDYDRTIAKVAKAYMLIWGDGRSNINVADALNWSSWSAEALAHFVIGKGQNRKFRQFDLIATNPPFAGNIAAEDTLAKYELAYKPSKDGKSIKRLTTVSRDKLFIERCLKSLTPGGRMAIVLPRGLLKNYTDENVRRYFLKQARVVAVVDLTGTMFKPFTNTKTCVLFLQKREAELDDLREANEDAPIVYAVSTKPGKDKSGNLIRDTKNRIQSDLPTIAEFVNSNATWF